MRDACRSKILAAMFLFPLLAISIARGADDAYFDVALDHLAITEGKLPKPRANDDWRNYALREMLRAYVVIDGPGDAYAVIGFANPNAAAPDSHLVIHTPEAGANTSRDGSISKTTTPREWWR